MFTPLERRKKAYEEVADQIRDKILAGAVDRDERLPTERDMATQFKVSRVAVREAVRVLELTGFVRVKNGVKGGVFVAQDYQRPVINSIRHLVAGGEVPLDRLFEVRYLIEPHAAEQVARHGTLEDFGELSATLREAACAAEEGAVYRAHNFRFHRLIVRMSGNAILNTVGDTVLAILVDLLRDLASPEISATQLGYHNDLLEALVDRDVEASRRIMIEDIAWLERAIGDQPAAANLTWPPRL